MDILHKPLRKSDKIHMVYVADWKTIDYNEVPSVAGDYV